ncbi:MAG: winged helix-turn-helix transcriptional regulator [Lachnospiraceae bacterium]|nr:winged helix-turn-helix transcriptional regulator [Lachnospiraceae bacterium]MBQ2101397.1 winged helix-turn-helix transcriptional regulator [Lachnospiraceae bacterium]MBQ3905455.1 winged helix-turn-helix transcriptional regulator [Lachnospiraceae bacterium]MCR4600049.1 metalloregulator ArsR/SmtB family transcription factor [Acetatifactor sp.]
MDAHAFLRFREKAGGTEVDEHQEEFLILTPQQAKEVEEKLPPAEEMTDLADFFKVFGDPTRLKILLALLCKEMCVCDIALLLGMTQSAISHQLRILKQMDLVKNRREGKTILYAPADDHIVSILSQGLDHIEE